MDRNPSTQSRDFGDRIRDLTIRYGRYVNEGVSLYGGADTKSLTGTADKKDLAVLSLKCVQSCVVNSNGLNPDCVPDCLKVWEFQFAFKQSSCLFGRFERGGSCLSN